MPNRRSDRVGEQIRHELAEIVRTRLKDPRIGFITITCVAVADDLSLAKVFVSELSQSGETGSGESLNALQHAQGFLRRELGQRMRLRHVPELKFEADISIERGAKVSQLLNEVIKTLPDEVEQDAP